MKNIHSKTKTKEKLGRRTRTRRNASFKLRKTSIKNHVAGFRALAPSNTELKVKETQAEPGAGARAWGRGRSQGRHGK